MACLLSQRLHEAQHREDCNADVARADWQPGYLLSRRQPSGARSGRPSEHLFGNVQACSPLRGVSNEEEEVVHVVFAASGGLRNVIAAVNSLPDDATPAALHLHVNDHNPRVALRNYLLLRLLFERGEDAVDAAIGLWYSMAVTFAQRTACLKTAE